MLSNLALIRRHLKDESTVHRYLPLFGRRVEVGGDDKTNAPHTFSKNGAVF